MKIKAKLYLGIGLLFLMILILAAVSTIFVSSLKKDTENVLSANYNSVEYARNMLKASDEIHLNKEAIAQLESNFARQRQNVTEQGEKNITDRLSEQLIRLKENPEDPQVGKEFRADLVKLMTVNMDAIVMKSDHAKEMASNAFVFISVVGALCFLIGFVLFINLPSNNLPKASVKLPVKTITNVSTSKGIANLSNWRVLSTVWQKDCRNIPIANWTRSLKRRSGLRPWSIACMIQLLDWMKIERSS